MKIRYLILVAGATAICFSGCSKISSVDRNEQLEKMYEEQILEEYDSKGINNVGVKAHIGENEEVFYDIWTYENEDIRSLKLGEDSDLELEGSEESCKHFPKKVKTEEVMAVEAEEINASANVSETVTEIVTEIADEEEYEYPVTDDEYELLCKLAFAEQTRAGFSQAYHDKEVANIVLVIMNRMESSEFPNTINGVIFDTKYGKQFSPAESGEIYWYPDGTHEKVVRLSDVPEECREAVKSALHGEYRNNGYLFYYASTQDVYGKDRICNTIFY